MFNICTNEGKNFVCRMKVREGWKLNLISEEESNFIDPKVINELKIFGGNDATMLDANHGKQSYSLNKFRY